MTLPSRLAGLLRIAALSCLGMINAVGASELPPLKLGIMPFNSPLALIKTHQPLTAHLEKVLGRKIVVHTSVDYFTHVNALLAGDFDIAITGPHFAAMAASRKMEPLVRYTAELNPLLVVLKESSIRTPADLRGKTIAMPSRLALISIAGTKWLQDNGLEPGRDFRIVEYQSHGASVAALTSKQADAAFSANTALRQMPEDIKARLRTQSSELSAPHVTTLAHQRLGNTEIARIRSALASFPATEAGQAFFVETGYLGYKPVSKADLERLQPFVSLTLQMMR